MTLKSADVLQGLNEVALEILKTEYKNIFASASTETVTAQQRQLETGFDRLIAFHALAIELATQKFKE